MFDNILKGKVDNKKSRAIVSLDSKGLEYSDLDNNPVTLPSGILRKISDINHKPGIQYIIENQDNEIKSPHENFQHIILSYK